MILHAIELHCVGPFCDDLRLGPFATGLNVLAAPNETGKTTALRAAARGLFDRHTTKSEELRSLQPVGTDLAPRIAVEFETAAGRFRIEKTFLQSAASQLQRRHGEKWERITEGDAADRKVMELLESSLPGRGATKPEHWGLLNFLWARQGELADWPALDAGEAGQKIRSRLVRIELDPVIERLREKLGTIAGEILLANGQPKKNGALDLAEKDLEQIDAALAKLQQTRAEIESTQQRFQQAVASVAQLEREQADRETAARTLKEQAETASRLQIEVDALQSAHETVREKLQLVSKDAQLLEERQQSLSSARTSLGSADEKERQAETGLAEIRRKIDEQQSARPDLARQLTTLREEHQRQQSLLKLRHAAAESATLSRQLSQLEGSVKRLAELDEKLSKLPELTPAKLTRLQELSDAMRSLEAQVQALGLTVELTPVNDGEAKVGAESKKLEADKTTVLHSPQQIDLELPGWGRIAIRSGAEESRSAAEQLDQSRSKFAAALEAADVASLEAARESLATRQALLPEIKAARAEQARQLGDHESFEALREATAAAARREKSLSDALQPTDRERAGSLAEFESEEARLATAIAPAEDALRKTDEILARLRADERQATEALQKCGEAASEQRTLVRTLESQIADLTARHPEGLDAAKSKAGSAFVEAEARLQVVRKKLPPDADQLPERNRRAAIALQQLLNDLKSRRTERDTAEGELLSLGGQGIYSRETELEERKVEVLQRRDAARSRGWSARLAQTLLDRHQQAATRAVLAPLEDRLSAAFARLTGATERRVFLDERLQVAGIGRERDAVHAFELLSQGAREQLLLCLRLAVAQELATDEPQSLILDDVLVNTDPVRQERVLDLLGTLSGGLQILILTCHPDRYRGIGQVIPFP